MAEPYSQMAEAIIQLTSQMIEHTIQMTSDKSTDNQMTEDTKYKIHGKHINLPENLKKFIRSASLSEFGTSGKSALQKF